ncbi:Zinc finger and BTB domain-containing protein 39 [Liparis tanakae]|uniref:Zinc finger and BTB domain-containing protein 39 n=1 Tax=Liparis tanakae TaxID=230148 RepID=A0A4Z2I7T8_9TELE|nr:Zinc finger and BTB domain-containing protein 39 [Liparis tanakae]
MTTHAEEAAAKEREQLALRTYRVGGGGGGGGAAAGGEELHCFLCPQTFRSASAFQYHLGLHSSESPGSLGGVRAQGWLGKHKAEQTLECLPSSSSQRDAGSLVKMSNMGLGLGMSFGVPDKFFQGALQSLPTGVLSNGNSGQDGGVGAAGVRGKWYRCRYCGKCFAHSGEFTYHLRIHTGEKPYQCKVCQRFFRGRSTMICHLKTHAGALMYRCTVCGLFFSTLKMVSSHMELHTDHLPPDFNIEQTFILAGAGVTQLALLPRVQPAPVGRVGPGPRPQLVHRGLSGYVVHHGVDQVAAEALAQEVVEDGVGDAVEQRQALHHVVREVEHVHRVAAEEERLQVVEDDHEHGQVVGQPAHDEHQGVQVHQPHVPTALHIRRRLNRAGDQHVAGDDDGGGDHELENQAEDRHGDEPLGVVLLGHHVAARLVHLQKIHVDVLHQTEEQGERPQASAEQPAAPARHGEEGGKRGLGQGQVALQGHEGQEEGAAVEVDHVDEVGELAEEASPEPNAVHGHLHHEEGHDDDHHQVRQAHVDDAEEDRVGGVPPAPVDPDDEAVLQQAHHEDEEVDQEEGDAAVLSGILQLEGALVDVPRGAVEGVQREVVLLAAHGLGREAEKKNGFRSEVYVYFGDNLVTL